jgi:prepilin peptidase CpaA
MHADASWFAWVIVGGAVGAALFDLATRRIPNWLTVAVLVTALAYHGAHGPAEFLQSAGAALVVVVGGTFLHARHWLGGGDVKLAAALTAGLALPGAIDFVLYTLLSGGVLALVVLVATRRHTLVAQGSALAAGLFSGNRPRPDGAALSNLRIPYAVAMAGGSVLAALALTVPALRLV